MMSDTKQNKLKPCPVCGSPACFIFWIPLYEIDVVHCSHAGCPMWVGTTFDAWQNRPVEDALRAENAKLRAALESLRRGDKEHDNYCACGDPDGLNFCTCSSRNTNAIIDAALKGDDDEQKKCNY